MMTVIRYVLFDSVKEIAYLVLDVKGRRKFKVTNDVLTGRMAKMLPSAVQLTLMGWFGCGKDITQISGPLFVVLVVLVAGWLWSVGYISRGVDKKKGDEPAGAKLT